MPRQVTQVASIRRQTRRSGYLKILVLPLPVVFHHLADFRGLVLFDRTPVLRPHPLIYPAVVHLTVNLHRICLAAAAADVQCRMVRLRSILRRQTQIRTIALDLVPQMVCSFVVFQLLPVLSRGGL